MKEIRIDLPTEQRSFRPGETIEGVVSWACDDMPKAVDVRLLCYTTGKGTQDVMVAEVMQIDDPLASDSRVFSFRAPDGPPSFNGRLVSLTWAIDAVADLKGLFADICARTDVVIAPEGKAIGLYHASE